MDTMLPPALTDAEATQTIDRKSARGAAMEVIVRGERWRNWTTEQECQIVAESLRPGLTPSEVAQRHGIGTGLLYTWRRQMLTGATGTLTRTSPGFTQVELSGPSGQETVAEPLEAPPPTPVEPSRLEGLIEIMLPGGVSLRVDAQVDGRALRRVLGRAGGTMIALASGLRIYLACGTTDMRKGMTGLAMLVQQGLAADPFDGAVFAFRGRRAGLIKLLWHDGIGLCMLIKRLEQGQFVWPSATSTGRIALSAPQLTALLDGCEWRAPVPVRRPELAG